MDNKIRQMINISWTSFKNKVASGIFDPENEKTMQLQLAQTLLALIPLFEYEHRETIKVLLEVPVYINRRPARRIIDIVVLHARQEKTIYFPIELKCFRKYTREKNGKKRGAQNLGMYNYWKDIENIEQYALLPNYSFGTQLTLTDDNYYVTGKHHGIQVSTYSTNISRQNVTGSLNQPVANKQGRIELSGNYSMTSWENLDNFHFIQQETVNGSSNPSF